MDHSAMMSAPDPGRRAETGKLRRARRGSGVLAVCAAAWSLAGSMYADDPVVTPVNASTVVVRIDRPVVTQPETDYPSVRLAPGDTVAVRAGGCVQTGGFGRTWKRYVDPSGDNSDRLYHGRIQIPTATAGLETIQGVMARSPLAVSLAPPGADLSQYFLRLGYDDDEYDDNGYYSHDDGTEDQCKNVGDAWVELTITHQAQNAPPPPPQLPRAPMDLWWSAVDDNLLPLNPLWGMQVDGNGNPNGRVPDAGPLCNNFHDEDDNLHLGNPPCTTQRPIVDEPSLSSDPAFYAVCQTSGGVAGAVHGHIDWGLATYTGTLFFTDHSVPVPTGVGDDDYDLTLHRPDQASATFNNASFVMDDTSATNDSRRSLGLEFDSDETIDHFDTPWWNTLHSAVDADIDGSFALSRRMIDGATAIATGIIGIDNKHGAHAELHPVLGLMARVPNRSGLDHDFWVFFARPRGDEGGCSQDLHEFSSTQTMQFLLPLSAVQRPVIAASDVRTNVAGGNWSATSFPDGLLITINFPPSLATDDGIVSPLVWGELTIAHAVPGLKGLLSPMQSAAGGTSSPAKTARPIARAGTGLRGIGPPISTRARPVPILGEDRDDYLGPIKAQLTAAEWKKFIDAYLHPPQPPRLVNHRFYVGRASFERSPSSWVRLSTAVNAHAIWQTSIPLQRTSAPGLIRHRTLAITEPRQLKLGARVANRAQLLQHQSIAIALQNAVGVARAQQILRSQEVPSRIIPHDSWALPVLASPSGPRR